MTKQREQKQKIDGRTAPAKRRRLLVAAYEKQVGSALSPATRSLIARAVAIEITLEGIEADQIAGKPFDAEKHARPGGLARASTRSARPDDSPQRTPPFRPAAAVINRRHSQTCCHDGANEGRPAWLVRRRARSLCRAGV